jgi:hypothetical protein
VTDPALAARDDAGWGLLEAGRRMGAHTWMEQRLFELAGSWSDATADLEARVRLATLSRHHGWRAEQWWALLPGLTDLPPHELVVPPTAEVAGALDELGARPDGGGRVVALYDGVLIGMADAYEAHARRCRPAADEPTARVLRHVLADLRHDLADVAGLLDRYREPALADALSQLRAVAARR